ncbi:MAG: O-antigen ligase family protein [Flavobacteriales bacterium]|nr:O-antigen ligase family protein [Flavobacteriales bacterium]
MRNFSNKKYTNKVLLLLLMVLFFKILGYFTLSENIVITRLLKVGMRVGMTGCVILLYRNMVSKGWVPTFQYRNMLAVFLYCGYLGLGLLSLLWSTNKGYSALQWVMNFESFIFALYFIQAALLIKKYGEIVFRFSKVFMYSVFMVLLIFVVGVFVDPDTFYRLTHGGEEARLGGYMMNPNELGMLAVAGIGAWMMEFREEHGKRRLWLLLPFGVMFYALILTGSRSSMIGFLLIVFYLINQSKKRGLKIAIYVGMFFSVPVIVQTIFIKQGDLQEVLSMTGRLPFWTALLTEGLPKEPMFGFGYMRIAYGESFQSLNTYAGKMTHNTFIQVLMNLGIVGFFTVVLQMAATIRGFKKMKDRIRKTFFFALFIPITINSFTEFGIFGEANFGILFYQLLIFWVVIYYNDKLSLKQRAQLRFYKGSRQVI